MKYMNFIFDLYGTLIDIHTDEEEPGLWKFMSGYLLKNFGTNIGPKELRSRYIKECALKEKELKKENGSSFPEIKIEWVWAELIGKPVAEDEIRKLCIAFREKSRDKMKVYDGVFEALSAIKKAGGRIFLLSNAQRLFTEKEMDDTGLTPYFDDIFISSDWGIKKPEVRFMEALIEKHNLNKEECVMIGNEEAADGKVAIAAGIDYIIVTDFNISLEKLLDKA